MASASKSAENGERRRYLNPVFYENIHPGGCLCLIFSRPLHPAAVHFPIAFLTLSYALDILYGLSTHPQTASLVRRTYDLAPYLGDIARFSYFANTLGIATAIPTVLTGGMEFFALIKRQDLLNKLQKSEHKADAAKRMHPKIKVGLAHALLQDVVIFAACFNWWIRRSTAGNAPTDVNVIVSSVCLPLLLLAASLGGMLVYDYGVGVGRQSTTRRLKEEGKAE
jgi:uncharacterized membrane protein